MGKTVDSRVVEMRFDNKQFEAGAKQTISTLDRLKEALKLPDTSKALKDIDKSVKGISLDGIASGVDALNKRFSTLGIVGMTAVSNVTNALMGKLNTAVNVVTNSIVSGGIKRAMNIENAHFQLQALLKDEKKVQAVMADAMESVDGTAYAYDEAAKAASQFAASGLQAGEEMLGALKGITGVAAMTNSDFESIATIFTTVAGNGRLMGDQLLQLASRGLNVSSTLADYFKEVRNESEVTEAVIREMVTKGQLDFKTFADAMTWAFGDSAKRANETFNGALSNMKSALARIGAGFVSPLVEQNGELVKLFNALRIKINEVKSELVFDEQRSAVAGLGETTGWTTKHLERMFEKIDKRGRVTIKQLNAMGRTGTDSLKALTEYLNGVTDGSIRATYSTKTAIDALTKGGEVSEKRVRRFVKKGKIDLAMFTSAMENAYGTEKTLTKQFTDFFLDTVKNITEMVNNLDVSKPLDVFYKGLDASKNVLKGLLTVLRPVKNAFAEVFAFDPNKFNTWADTLVNLTSKMRLSEKGAKNLQDTFKGLFDFSKLLIDIFVDLISAIIPINKPIMDVGDSFLDLTGYLGRMLSSFSESARESEILATAIKFIATVIKTGTKGVTSFAKTIISLTKSIAEFKPVTKLVDALITVFSKMGEIAAPHVKKFKDNLSDLTKELSKFGKTSLGKAIELISKSFDSLIDKIKTFSVKGFIDQIKSLTSSVKGFNSAASDNKGIKAFIENMKNYAKALKEGLSVDDALGRLENIMKAMGKFITWVRDTFGPALQELNFGSALVAYGFVGIITALNKAATGFSTISKSFEKFPGILTGVKDALHDYQTKLKAESIESIAKAIGILAGALVLLSFADPENLMVAAVALGTVGTALFTSFANIKKAAAEGNEANAALNKFASGFKGLLNKFGRSLEIKAIGSAVKDLGIGIALIAASIVAIGLMYRKDEAAMRAALVAVEEIGILIGAIMGIGALIIAKLGEGAKQFRSIGIGIAAIGVGLLLAVISLKKLMDMEIPKDYATKLVILGGLILGIAALCITVGMAGSISEGANVSLGALIGVAALLYVSVMALKKLFKMEIPNDVGTKIFIFGLLFAGIAGLLIALGAMGNLSEGASKAKDVATLGNLLLKAMVSLSVLAQMNPGQLLKGAASLSAVILAVGLALRLASGIQSDQSASAIQAMSAVITSITAALGILGLMPWESLLKGAGSLTLVLLAVAEALKQAGKNTGKESYGSIIAMIGAVVVITGALWVLSQQPWDSLLAGGTALGEVLLALSISFAVLGKVKMDLSTVATFALGIAALAGIAAVLHFLIDGENNWYAMIPAATALSETLIGLSIAMAICSKFGAGGPKAALAGILGLDLFIANLWAVVRVLGEFADDDMVEKVTKGGELLVQLGQILGDFVGAIVAGIINSIVETLPNIADQLSNFMTHLQPFLAGVKALDAGLITKAGFLAAIVLAFMTEGLIGAFAIIPGLGLIAIALELCAFIDQLQPFIDGLQGINEGAVNAAKSLATLILALTTADLIEGIGRLIGLKGGSLKGFGEQLKEFGPAIVEFANSVSGLSEDAASKAQAAADIGATMVTLAKSLYGEEGLVQRFLGEKNLGRFGTQMKTYGNAVVSFANTVKDVDPNAVQGAKDVGDIMQALQGSLTPIGGVIEFFTGSQSLSTFGSNLESYGDSLNSFIDKVKGVKSTDIIGVQTVTRMMTMLSEGLPNQTSTLGKLFFGDDSFAGFGKNLKEFGEYIVAFIDQVDGANFAAIDDFKEAMDKLMQVAKDSEGLSFDDLMGLGSLGAGDAYTALEGFISGIDSAKETVLTKLRIMLTQMINTINSYKPRFESAGLAAIVAFMDGFKSDMSASVTYAMNNIISAIRATYSQFKAAGNYVGDGFVQGILDKKGDAYNAGYELGKQAAQGTKDATDQASPSKVMRKIGDYTGLGFILGFRSYIQKSYKTGVLLGDSASEGAKIGLKNMTGLLEESLVSPVIRPKADLSGIRKSADQISQMFNDAVLVSSGLAKDIQLKMSGRIDKADLVAGEIRNLQNGLGSLGGDTYNINGISYSESSDVGDALKTIIRVANIKRRV